jgi:hypothetical protein
LLFSLFIDRIEKWFAERLPAVGVALGEALVRALLYVDDLTLLAKSPTELQALLHGLEEFCAQYKLEVNVGKCAVVVFGQRAPRRGVDIPAQGWLYGGEALPLASEFRYLGVTFHQSKGVSACTSALSAAGLRAM